MCGLAGEIALAPAAAASLERAEPMLAAIMHRGPDGQGSWQDPHARVAFRHCRLSIVDVANGRQPMTDPAGDIAVVFNGEIYGFERHRKAMSDLGYGFRTRCDTEVLIALYQRYGADFVARLEGEFAFVLHDSRERRTLLARDRFGIKPLFVSRRGDHFLFGSEIKAILANPLSQPALNRVAMYRRLHGVNFPEETVFAGVDAVPPGATLIINGSGSIGQVRHSSFDLEAAGQIELGRDAAEESFEDALSTAVRERLQGDDPVGIYLSGGVDSTLMSAVTREVSNVPHHTFTVGFEAPDYGEATPAEDTARRLGLRHEVVRIGERDLEAHFARSIWHGETPAPNGQGTAKMLLARRASRGVKAVLAGEGIDEIHGGYAYFRHAGLLQEASSGAGREALKAFAAVNGPHEGVLSFATARLRKRLSGPEGRGVPYAAIRAALVSRILTFLLTPEFKGSAEPDPAGQLLDWLDARAPAARHTDDVTLSRYTSAITDLPTYNFSYLCDRAEMASGIEGRLPFLDKRVVDLVWGLPQQFHVSESSNKTLVRSALARRMPQSAERAKKMFIAPGSTLAGAFDGEVARRWLSAETTREVGIFRPRAVELVQALTRRTGQTSRLRHLLEGILLMMVSAHMLEQLFCKELDRSLGAFAAAPPKA